MAKANDTRVTEFILLGFPDRPELQATFFLLFLVIYLITLMGNLGMIALIRMDSQLHTPMYFFLSHLSLVDACNSSVVIPKMLVNFLVDSKAISSISCAAQMYFFVFFATTDLLLLSVMAYDRYVAVCNPLLYTAVMSPRVCAQLVAGSYACSTVSSMIHTCFTFSMSFCGSNVISHFFCDIPPLLALSCSDTSINEMLLFILGSTEAAISLLIILVSYLYILAAILQIRSAKGRRKAFSTCTSHLTVVTMLYGSLSFMYLRPSSSYALDQDMGVSVFYTVLIPMLNPLIYSLRNTEVRDALRRVIGRKIFTHLM
ncbi:olfactory receptor 5J3-like [Emydura macquarii macquarii]|uniref:olfactory receptor 5J3-like n=1 Tax=Emydura macquarii macquarii TaxID=1129001 RepID=UPI00352A5554